MKKQTIILLMAMIFVSTAFAQSPHPVAPACTNAAYPDLYTDAYDPGKKVGTDEITYVIMTVPLTNVTKIGDKTYEVKHPIYLNECQETSSIVYDKTGMDSFNKIWDKAQSKPSAIKDMDISIKFEYINGIATGKVVIHAFGYPNDF